MKNSVEIRSKNSIIILLFYIFIIAVMWTNKDIVHWQKCSQIFKLALYGSSLNFNVNISR